MIDIGFDAQTPSLPQGGGAVCGLGETYTPDMSTGTGSYSIPLDCPNGANDVGPRLALRYDSSAGNGPFGLGFGLPLPRILRSTAGRFPRYDGSDPLMLEGAGELVAVGDGVYRPQVDGGAWRVAAHADGFRLTDRDGMIYDLGTDLPSRLIDPNEPGAVYAWHLAGVRDALGNAVSFTWQRDGGQLYLEQVAYSGYEVRFRYEERPDAQHWGRAGFLITTSRRCVSVELHLAGDAASLVRRWDLAYEQDPANGCSLLTSVVLSGFDADGGQLAAPALRLGYTGFSPGGLSRLATPDGMTAPGPLTRTDRRVELVDWNGDGLPDLMEIRAGGRARRWPNLGDGRLGAPHLTADLPYFATPTAAVGFVDMDGDGAADLVRTDLPLSGYTPRSPGNGFGRPVSWPSAPPVRLDAPSTRVVDLDGDGRADVMVSTGRNLLLYLRAETGGWQERPRVVGGADAPTVNLADARIHVADMTGDGTADLVRVSGSGVTYWPYLGEGRWGAPVRMAGSPALPADFRPADLFLTDVDGDGCADVVYVRDGSVRLWINQSGNGFSSERRIDCLPTGRMDDLRLADMRGSGTAGLLWSTPAPFRRGSDYFYLDFIRGQKPHLLNRIDNGVGRLVEIEYSTSAQEAARDARDGRPWSTRLPVVIPVVARMTVTEAVTGRVMVTRYRYHEGRYDGPLREFAGFGRVEEEQAGDGSVPALLTTTWFHTGLDHATGAEPATAARRRRLRAVRGRILQRERTGSHGTAGPEALFQRFEQHWSVEDVDTPGGPVHVPKLITARESTFEGAAQPCAVVTTTNLAWDDHGNVTETLQTSEDPADPGTRQVLRTRNTFAADPAGRFLSKLARTQQFTGDDTLIADTINAYDGGAAGTVGPRGLVTERCALVLTDTLAAEVYGDDLPDFAALGYHRRDEAAGWWVTLAAYERVDDADGLRGTVTGPRGARTTFRFDPLKVFPVEITQVYDNAVTATYDPRLARPVAVTTPAGGVYRAVYDALTRLTATIEPGDTEALPTNSLHYDTTTLPVRVSRRRRAVSGQQATIDTSETFDGAGLLLERRIRDETGEISLTSRVYNCRGLPARDHLEQRATQDAYAPPDAASPHTGYSYDALGRLIKVVNPDGSQRTITYGPRTIEEADEEDNAAGSAAAHAGTVTRQVLDATGRIRAIEERLGPRTLVSRYDHDVKGNLVRHVDALGNTVDTAFDLLGRVIRVKRPEQTVVTVHDASGNACEVRTGGGRVVRQFDLADRPVSERHGDAPPSVRFTYHDKGTPAPPEAGAHSAGHLVRVDDPGGTTVFAYDTRGRRTRKAWTPPGGGTARVLDFTYRCDGQLSRVEYPDSGGTRTVLDHTYDERGLLSSIPTVATEIRHDLAGRRTRIGYANGTTETMSYDRRGRLASQRLTGPGGVLWQASYALDRVGNLVRVDSSDPAVAVTYRYDDLYRLTEATLGDGTRWTYAYDDAGNLTHKSDVGDYRYGENGAPATCLTSAGPGSYTYTPNGEMATTPWGDQRFDPLGRLLSITAPDGAGAITFTYDHSGARVTARTTGTAAPAVDLVTPDPLYAIDGGTLVLNLGGLARDDGDGRVFLHFDHRGGLVTVTDEAGAVVESVRYDPYGAVLSRTGPHQVPLGFAGGVPDDWTGLLYLRTRYYAPHLGRFVSPDPVVQSIYEPIAWASYVYCRNNPASYVDPMGTSFWRVFAIAVAVVALIALCVVTFGAATPLSVQIGIGVGVLLGGTVGGVAAARSRHHTAGDIVAGILVGAAVGGWAAYASAGLGAVVTDALGKAIPGSMLAGSVAGTVNGTAMGFAASFGGQEKFSDAIETIWHSALIGAGTGAALGFLTGAVNSGDIKRPDKSLAEATKERVETFVQEKYSRQGGAPTQGPSSLDVFLRKILAYIGEPWIEHGEYIGGKLGALAWVQVIAEDLPAGAWGVFHEDINEYLLRHHGFTL
ncbi:MAG TPA: toxin TcdB middle/N-terminal domain-containing protein [Nonomuraea sp.]|nr:toxin TcdB middle/N-terminal domain-containing protein [Nonomuraea sp.]